MTEFLSQETIFFGLPILVIIISIPVSIYFAREMGRTSHYYRVIHVDNMIKKYGRGELHYYFLWSIGRAFAKNCDIRLLDQRLTDKERETIKAENVILKERAKRPPKGFEEIDSNRMRILTSDGPGDKWSIMTDFSILEYLEDQEKNKST